MTRQRLRTRQGLERTSVVLAPLWIAAAVICSPVPAGGNGSSGQTAPPPAPPPGPAAKAPAPPAPPAPKAPLKALTEPAIQAVLADLRRAAGERDPEGVIRHYAPDCILTGTSGPKGKEQVVRMTREEYHGHLQQFFKGVGGYQIEHANVRIEIAEGGKTATVHDDFTEETILAGFKVKTVSPEELTFTLVDGRPMISASRSLEEPTKAP